MIIGLGTYRIGQSVISLTAPECGLYCNVMVITVKCNDLCKQIRHIIICSGSNLVHCLVIEQLHLGRQDRGAGALDLVN